MDETLDLIICVDDTDDLTKSTSTGAVAERIAQIVQECGGYLPLGISRHQLLLHPDVNYTSHNSAMAFSARIVDDSLDEIYTRAVAALDQMKADTANPGLCMVVVPEDDYEEYQGIKTLVDFGLAAKMCVISKDEALRTANSIPWVTLTEHGGTGEGVIGALAGAGLRLSGCDGRFRGKWDLTALCGGGGEVVTNAKELRACAAAGDENPDEPVLAIPAAHLLEILEEQARGVAQLVDPDGVSLGPKTLVALVREAKPVLYGNTLTLVCELRDGVAWPCDKAQLEETPSGFCDTKRSCARFEADNDEEEMIGADEAAPICANCLYRRWTAQGFACMRKED